MIKNSGRILVVCCFLASLFLSSCADQLEPGQDLSKFDGSNSKLKEKLAVLKPPAADAVASGESRPVAPTTVTDTGGSASETSLKVPKLRQALSSMPAPDIRQLIGLNSTELNHLLGKPLLVRREADAEVWQYPTANCVLHLFLYRNSLNNPSYRVVHVEANHSQRIKFNRKSIDLYSLEQKKLLNVCFSRLLSQAKVLDSPS